VLNYLCLLGWSPKDNREMLSLEEIRGLFELQSINRRNAIFDMDKCFWLNGQYILQMSLERFYELSVPFVEKAGIAYESREDLLRALAIVKPKVKHLSDVPTWIGFLFTDDYPFEAESVEKALEKPGALENLKSLGEALDSVRDWSHGVIESKLKETAAALGRKPGDLVHPARVAVSGKSVGPGLYEMFEILGRKRVLARFARAASLIDQRPE
jgi:glutamyl-tRNA synthetase